MNGLRLATEVRAKHPSVEIVVVSGRLRTMPLDVPDARFFIKPYDTAAIVNAVVSDHKQSKISELLPSNFAA